MYNVRKLRELISFINTMIGPVVGQFIPCFHAKHPLFYPFFAMAERLPISSRSTHRKFRINRFAYPLVANFRKPQFEWFGIWRWY